MLNANSPQCTTCGVRPAPKITNAELRMALDMLLPLPQLKTLRLSVAPPDFLTVLDLELYRKIANGLPALEKLWLSPAEFQSSSFTRIIFRERVPLRNLAAFCSMLPNLVEVTIGAVEGLTLEETPQANWACFGVKKLVIVLGTSGVSTWRGSRGVSCKLLHRGLKTYFPNSDLAKEDFNSLLNRYEGMSC